VHYINLPQYEWTDYYHDNNQDAHMKAPKAQHIPIQIKKIAYWNIYMYPKKSPLNWYSKAQ